MEVEGVSRQALELGQPDLGQAPEAFDAVDMDDAFGELVAGMVDADVAIAEVDQAVVAAPGQRWTLSFRQLSGQIKVKSGVIGQAASGCDGAG